MDFINKEQEILARQAKDGEKEAKEYLYYSFLPLADSIIRNYDGNSLERKEIHQITREALDKSLEQYWNKEDREYRLGTFMSRNLRNLLDGS